MQNFIDLPQPAHVSSILIDTASAAIVSTTAPSSVLTAVDSVLASATIPSPSIFTNSSSFFSRLPCATLARSAALHIPLKPSSHSPHFLPTGAQMVWPKPTSNQLISCHLSRGSQLSSAALVCSGVLVVCHPHRFVMRCTCTSTPMPSTRPHAVGRTRCAILGPTPGNATRPSKVSGISPSHSSRQMAAACLRYLVLLLWNPTAHISSFSFAGSTASIFSRFNPGGAPSLCGGSSVCNLFIATALVVSLVWLESINATRVWKRWSRGLAVLSANRSQPMVSTAALAARPPGKRMSLAASYNSSQSEGGWTMPCPVLESVVLRAGLRARRAGEEEDDVVVGNSFVSIPVISPDSCLMRSVLEIRVALFGVVAGTEARFRFREGIMSSISGGGGGGGETGLGFG